jgi:hypothetical protein
MLSLIDKQNRDIIRQRDTIVQPKLTAQGLDADMIAIHQ